ncbi:hypothetical protein PFISCL1PPCAC_4705 [Pristionchus fissidentatus]|uniref:DOMON domain-containing protein n=1 Tax=Pristionchus fissidentatus TaxID=1538716 RepID=A0AAV5V555_9BILA|nr:hypothetical protein PFISCL1PPCAC_4705 [Pristionchus fissidentatus]
MLLSLAVMSAVAQISLAQLDTTSCGKSKGCLFAPQGCNSNPSSCQITMSYVMNGTDMVFELQGKPPSGGYMAIGFSYDMTMGNDSVSLCYQDNELLGYNEGKTFVSQATATTRHMLEAFTATNGETYCRIRRGISGNGNPMVFNLDMPYTIFLAHGPMNNGAPGYHQMNKWMLPQTAVTAYSVAGGFNPSTTAMPGSSMAPGGASSAPGGATTAPTPVMTTTKKNGADAAVSLFGCAAVALAVFSLTR